MSTPMASRPPTPPTSTLSPYTTLFRSYDFSADMGSLISEDQIKTVTGHLDDAKVKGATVVAGGNARPEDRKSTRLNSSHVAISYAVFCLKKKIILALHAHIVASSPYIA